MQALERGGCEVNALEERVFEMNVLQVNSGAVNILALNAPCELAGTAEASWLCAV